MGFIKMFVGFLIAFSISSTFFSLDVSDIRTLGMAEDEVLAIENQLRFSEHIVGVLERARSDLALLGYLLACPGSTAMLLAEEAYKETNSEESSLYHRIGAIGWAGGRCAPPQVDGDALALWQNVSGGHLNWFFEETLLQTMEWLQVNEELGHEADGSHVAAAEFMVGFLGSLSRAHLRCSLAMHRALGFTAITPDWEGDVKLTPRDGDSEATALTGAHASLNEGPAEGVEVEGDSIVSSAENEKISQENESSSEGGQHDETLLETSGKNGRRWWKRLRTGLQKAKRQDKLGKNESGRERERLFAKEAEVVREGEDVVMARKLERRTDECEYEYSQGGEYDETFKEASGKKCDWWKLVCKARARTHRCTSQLDEPKTAARKRGWFSKKEAEAGSDAPTESIFNDVDEWIRRAVLM